MENHKTDNLGKFWDFHVFTLNMIFEIFPKTSPYQNGNFQEISEIYLKGGFGKT